MVSCEVNNIHDKQIAKYNEHAYVKGKSALHFLKSLSLRTKVIFMERVAM